MTGDAAGGRPSARSGTGRGLSADTHPPRRVGREMEFREHGGLPQAAGPANVTTSLITIAKLVGWVIAICSVVWMMGQIPSADPQEDMPEKYPSLSVQMGPSYNAGQVVSGSMVVFDH